MSAAAIAKVYAEALFALASERGRREAFDREIAELAGVFREQREIRNFFSSPGTPREEKLKVIDESIAPHVDDLAANFLRLLVRKGRELLFGRILEAYEDLVDAAEGRIEVRVRSAVELSDEVAGRITEELARMTGQTVQLQTEVDPGLIGGLAIRLGDRLLDASLATRLRRLRERALGG
jgi:F-type H+-transporting ATPase subunit delta